MDETLVSLHKHRLVEYYAALDNAGPGQLPAVLDRFRASAAPYHTVHPLNDLIGNAALADRLLQPLRQAVPDLRHRCFAVMAGSFEGGDWASAFGVLEGGMTGDWLGVPATKGLVNLRFGEFHRFAAGMIVESYAIYDIVDLLRQAGRQLLPAPPLGSPSIFPAPATQDGLDLRSRDPAESAKSLALVEAMIFGLMQYDQADLKSMGVNRFWSPDMLWYGPGGIGATRGVSGFQAYHQKPFLTAFPDRKGGNHKARYADGVYVNSTGWPSIHATHVGPWLGVPGKNNPITMRVMDWWRRDGDALIENWVFIDVPHTLLQSGFDLFAALS